MMAKSNIWLTVLFLLFGFSGPAIGQSTHAGHGQSDKEGHAAVDHDSPSGTFVHKAVVDGIRAEFQIMSLASMNMKDPGGATHHVMVTFFDDAMGHQIKKLAGKVKVIAPSGKDQVGTLKDYSGVYAANFTFDEKGKWGLICLFKVEKKKHTVKFWYPHN